MRSTNCNKYVLVGLGNLYYSALRKFADAAVNRIAPQAQCYQRRRPEKTLWYRTVQTHFETWLALSTGQGDESPPAHVEQAFRRYLECGILAHGFARAYCDE